jgi:RND family efflux transporter MFP subunit
MKQCLLFCGSWVGACLGAQQPGPQPSGPQAPKSVEVVAPSRADVVRRLTLPATIRPDLAVEVRSPVAGILRSIAVDLGDRVDAGAVLAVLDQPDLALERPLQEARVHAARLREAAASAEAEAAKVALVEPRQMLARLRAARAESKDTVAESDLEAAEARSAMAQARADVAAAAAAAAGSEVALATAALERIDAVLALGTIRAPFAGVVGRRLIDPGAAIPVGTQAGAGALVTLLRDDRVRVQVDVPQDEAHLLQAGTTTATVLAGAPGTSAPLAAKVSRLAGDLDAGTRSLRAEIDVENRDHRLRPGMFARATLDLETRRDALTVPSSALVEAKSKFFVLVVREGRARRVPVQLGADDGVRAEILSGLGPADQVVRMGAAAASDLEAVRAVPSPAGSR